MNCSFSYGLKIDTSLRLFASFNSELLGDELRLCQQQICGNNITHTKNSASRQLKQLSEKVFCSLNYAFTNGHPLS
ncbi:hypothetical protein GJ496_007676 [Pomphorhynchus laevis]|nr:hypothetical protein GJ496_007676 [Pomphorhynchus laevis]